jgi:hypothetical protein
MRRAAAAAAYSRPLLLLLLLLLLLQVVFSNHETKDPGPDPGSDDTDDEGDAEGDAEDSPVPMESVMGIAEVGCAQAPSVAIHCFVVLCLA